MKQELREKIQRVILEYLNAIHAELIHSHDDVFLTDKILTLICEEIEKVENPYLHPKGRWEGLDHPSADPFEEARQNILTLLRSEKKEV